MKKSLLLSIGLLSVASALQSQDKIFWGDQNLDKIYKANLDLTSSEPVADVQNPSGIAYFYSEPAYTTFYSIAFYIYRMKNDGSDAGQIINTPGSQFNRGIAIDYQKKKIYWVNQADGTIKRANLDGTSQEPVLSGLTDPWDIELDLVNHKIYWTEGDGADGKISRANMDGTGVTPVITNVRSEGVAVDPTKNKIYYTDRSQKKVFAATLSDGSGATAIYTTNLSIPSDIDIHFATGKLYVADYGTNRIIPMDPNGTVTTDLTARGTFMEIGDMTAPSVTSIKRQSPTTEHVDEGTDLTTPTAISPSTT
jgi:DNA-binding beta-propeller fold protein YncE